MSMLINVGAGLARISVVKDGKRLGRVKLAPNQACPLSDEQVEAVRRTHADDLKAGRLKIEAAKPTAKAPPAAEPKAAPKPDPKAEKTDGGS